MDEATKRCTKCGENKPISAYPIRIDRGRKPRSHCRSCHNARAKEPRSKELQAAWRFATKYGLTLADVDAMMAAQSGQCAICSRTFGEVPRHIDHDHQTGKVRGLLCGGCNVALGLLQDDPTVAAAAAAYLAQHKAVAA
jgi:hypothetical protein